MGSERIPRGLAWKRLLPVAMGRSNIKGLNVILLKVFMRKLFRNFVRLAEVY
jgi:hypothetical protein